MSAVAHSCCSAAGVFVVLRDGSMWWRKHAWLSEQWQPIAPPGVAQRRGDGSETVRSKLPRRQRRR